MEEDNKLETADGSILKYPEGFYEGVPIYKTERALEKTVKKVVLEAKFTDEEMEENTEQSIETVKAEDQLSSPVEM